MNQRSKHSRLQINTSKNGFCGWELLDEQECTVALYTQVSAGIASGYDEGGGVGDLQTRHSKG